MKEKYLKRIFIRLFGKELFNKLMHECSHCQNQCEDLTKLRKDIIDECIKALPKKKGRWNQKWYIPADLTHNETIDEVISNLKKLKDKK